MPAATATRANGNGHGKAEVLEDVTNDAANMIGMTQPYIASVRITGDSPLLFHRWSNEAVAAKADAAKGSRAKKTDDTESFVYRMPFGKSKGNIALPGEYVRQSMIGAARFIQDPRSTRKSGMDLVKAGVVSLTELADLGQKAWDYLDQRRVLVQRNAVTRSRPAFNVGWTAELELMVNLPEYVSPQLLQKLLADAGRLIGVGDFRPTYGRFRVTRFDTRDAL
jgi:hypothetical protein